MEESELEKLRKDLYKEGKSFKERFKEDFFTSPRDEVSRSWQINSDSKRKNKSRRDLIEDFMKSKKKKRWKILIGFFLLFLILVFGSVVYFFFYGGVVVSGKNIEIKVQGSSSLKSGEIGDWYILVVNHNKVPLETADLIIDYPKTSFSLDNKPLVEERRSLGLIPAGSSAEEEIRAFVFNQENSEEVLKISLEYRLKGSNAIFSKSFSYPFILTQPPVGISLKLPDSIESGQEFSFEVNLVSNSEVVLKNIYVKLDYPPGFIFSQSEPEPAVGDSIWRIGDLAPLAERHLKIKGSIEGQDLTELGFKASAGFFKEGENIDTPFASAGGSLVLKRPFLNFSFKINGADLDSVLSTSPLKISIPWRNNLATDLRNVVIEVSILGKAIDFSSLRVDKGFYRASDNKIIWNAGSLPELARLNPGDSGKVSFSFSLKNPIPLENITDKNLSFILDGRIFGLKFENGKSLKVESSSRKEVKIASRLQLANRLLYGSGPFKNSGPLPPQVGKETTYTIVWSLTNFYNDVSNVEVRAFLPAYVKWLNFVSPSDEDVKYNPATGEVVWKIKNLSAGVGILMPAREVAFQIGFSPALNQVNSSPSLISETSVQAKDDFTGLELRDFKPGLNISMIDEANRDSRKGIVSR